MTENKALVVHGEERWSLVPRSMGDAMEIANLIAQSDFAPKDYKGKPGNVVIAMQMGIDLGLKPMQALQNIAVINGRPSIWGDAALALVQAKGILERFHEKVEGDGEKMVATCTIKRQGMPDEFVRTFSFEDARRAGLWGKSGPWTQYPKRMMQMRARSFALRDAAPDVMMGLVLAEEAQDYIDTTVVAGSDVHAAEPVNPLEGVDEALQTSIGKGFEALNMSEGQRAVKVNEFMSCDGSPSENAQALLDWLKDEWSKRKTGQPRKKNGDNSRQPKEKSAGSASTVTPEPKVAEKTSEPEGTQAPAADEIF